MEQGIGLGECRCVREVIAVDGSSRVLRQNAVLRQLCRSEAADREFHCSEFEGHPSVELCVRLRDRQMFFTDLVRAGS